MPRGALFFAMPGQEALLDAAWAELSPSRPSLARLDTSEACALVPVLRPDMVVAALYEPGEMDIDVHALHSVYLRRLLRRGGRVVIDAPVKALARAGGVWTVSTP